MKMNDYLLGEVAKELATAATPMTAMTARHEGVKHTLGRAQICGQFGDRTFMCIGRECVAKFDHGDANLPHAENAAYAALAWNTHSQLTAEVARLREALTLAEPYMSADVRGADIDHFNMVRRMVREALSGAA